MSSECRYVFTKAQHRGTKCNQSADGEYCPIHTILTRMINEGRSLDKDLSNLEQGLSFKKLELDFHRLLIKLDGQHDDKEKKMLKDIDDAEQIISAIKTYS